MSTPYSFELHYGRIKAIHDDGTVDIVDFKNNITDSAVYTNVLVEQPASDMQVPVVNNQVLFFTINIDTKQILVKIIKIYGSDLALNDYQRAQTGTMPLEPGEHRITSQTGSTLYVANGALGISSLGQSIILDDASLTTLINVAALQLVTLDGFQIDQVNGSGELNISKGTFDKKTGKVTDVVTSIKLNANGINITSGGDVNINAQDNVVIEHAKSVDITVEDSGAIMLNGNKGVVLAADLPPGSPITSFDQLIVSESVKAS